ncbi:unnamed protein product [Dovyalis caffra]|uniref:Uncharacterized protein n=1 Tax=Dovyalis caffra TaxID=77055 RepID=A0AAV1QWS8_9ROSI|nr:unnamed protein product [Dovyalis caffra]
MPDIRAFSARPLSFEQYIDLEGCGPGAKSQLHYKVDEARCIFANIGVTLFGSLVFAPDMKRWNILVAVIGLRKLIEMSLPSQTSSAGNKKNQTKTRRLKVWFHGGPDSFGLQSFEEEKTRSQYECLSSGAALSYNVSDFYIHDAPTSGLHFEPSVEKKTPQEKGHRRFWSVHEDFSGGFSSPADRSPIAASQTKQLVRFRSQRV